MMISSSSRVVVVVAVNCRKVKTIYDPCDIVLIVSLFGTLTGKLFRSSDLSMVVEFFLMFHKDKPVDWLMDHILWVKVCNPEKDTVSKYTIHLYERVLLQFQTPRRKVKIPHAVLRVLIF